MNTQENKHTPGPWEAEMEHGGHSSYVTAYGGESVCAVSLQDPQADGGRDYAREHANARLIAAAPELLEALKKAAFVLSRAKGMGAEIALKHARTAIAKANGA